MRDEGVNVCNYIAPGIYYKDGFEVTVTEKAKGKKQTMNDLKSKDHVYTLGKWLRQFHGASRRFGKTDIPEWKVKDGGWQTKLLPPTLETDDEHYGVIHGDFSYQAFSVQNDGTI